MIVNIHQQWSKSKCNNNKEIMTQERLIQINMQIGITFYFSVNNLFACRYLLQCNKIFIKKQMIKNKTLEFKERYSNSLSSKQNKTTIRDSTPELLKFKLGSTGFTNFTAPTAKYTNNSKRIAKVQSTVFLKTRSKMEQPLSFTQTKILKKQENQTSLCRYLNFNTIKMENEVQKKENDSETTEKSVLNEQKQIKIRQLSNIEGFFKELTPRSLFFCCKCFRYHFAIQRNLHYPKCESQIDISMLQKKEIQRIGWQKINLMIQLSEYTKYKHKQIMDLYKQFKEDQPSSFFQVQISENASFLRFQQIIEAFVFTFQKLIWPNKMNNSGIFSMKKLFQCTEATKNSSVKYERNFFQ